MITWGEFATQEPELATFGQGRLTAAPAYLATIRRSGAPRVHPVTPIFTTDGLFLFMEPSSPKGQDIRERAFYAVSGQGFAVEDPEVRAFVARSASYEAAERYVLFELKLTEARCNGYGDTALPARRRWSAET